MRHSAPPHPTHQHDDSVFTTLTHAHEPLGFEELVARVQKQGPHTRSEIAAALARLITRQSAFLNQERTGFLAVRPKRDSQRFLERAVSASTPTSTVRFA